MASALLLDTFDRRTYGEATTESMTERIFLAECSGVKQNPLLLLFSIGQLEQRLR